MRTGRLVFVLSLVLAGACTWVGDESLLSAIDEVPPRVLSVYPPDGWRQIPVGIEVRVWFSETLDPLSVGPDSVRLFSGESTATCDFTLEAAEDGRMLLTLRPMPSLLSGVRYTLVLTDGITDLVGNPLDPPIAVEFTTLP
jgi:hypothetical protein